MTQATAFFENRLAPAINLNGLWQFRLADSLEQTVQIPSAWETHVPDKLTQGPAVYRRTFEPPEEWLGKHVLLEAQAISFDATVRLNGRSVSHHNGMWAPFQLDLTPYVRPGMNDLEIEVWKPGTRFALRESLAGFLPDVATTFGGIWQGIRVICFSSAALHGLRMLCGPANHLFVEGYVEHFGNLQSLTGQVTVTGSGQPAMSVTFEPRKQDASISFTVEITLPDITHWGSNQDTQLYDVTVTLYEPGLSQPILEVTRRIGFRELVASEGRLWLNNQPLHMRGVLDWGWDAKRICPTPTREQVLDQIGKARALGFNMIKLCLFVPDETTFDVADEQGILLWLELPMWLPTLTAESRALALREYDAILRRVHHHPSIAVVSLGCELSSAVDAQFLGELDQRARKWLPQALHCDNSGSAEAYGGVVTALSDFYDYHFYTDPHFFKPLVDHFTRPYQPRKPWIYGEFCDADTLRDFNLLPHDTWWLNQDLPLHRDELTWMRDYRKRLQDAGINDNGAALTKIARQQATAVRKFIFEQVRSRNATGGYVITGWIDTPISTSGVVDDDHQLKFSPAEWRQFNDDCVLVLDRERRRRWRGGDQPVHTDPFTWWQGDTAEVHLALANGYHEVRSGRLSWQVIPGDSVASVDLAQLPDGEVTELATLHLPLPTADPEKVKQLELHATADLKFADGTRRHVTNTWRLWAIPDKQQTLQTVADIRVAHNLTTELLAQVQNGASALVWLNRLDKRFTVAMPFWREAIHVFAAHPLWEAVPHPGYADMRFFSVATEIALDVARLAIVLGAGAKIVPVWRRFDARSMTWADYVIEVRYGTGRLFVSTLRFAGGLGSQPDTFDTSPFGAWIMHALMRLLRGRTQ